MKADGINKRSMIFNISKIKKDKFQSPVHPTFEKHQSYKFFLLKKKRIINKKLTLHEIIKSGYNVGRWEMDEHDKFIKSCMSYKNNWRKVLNHYYLF
jgi:hypothetical protein